MLRNAVAWFAERGVTVQRVLCDNGSCYRSHLWRDTCADLGITPEEDPALPAADQRQDRTVPPHPGRGLGVQEVLQLRVSPPRRSASMGPRVQPPPAPLGHREALTHHQVGQPGWASHLGGLAHGGSPHPTSAGMHRNLGEVGQHPVHPEVEQPPDVGRRLAAQGPHEDVEPGRRRPSSTAAPRRRACAPCAARPRWRRSPIRCSRRRFTELVAVDELDQLGVDLPAQRVAARRRRRTSPSPARAARSGDGRGAGRPAARAAASRVPRTPPGA